MWRERGGELLQGGWVKKTEEWTGMICKSKYMRTPEEDALLYMQIKSKETHKNLLSLDYVEEGAVKEQGWKKWTGGGIWSEYTDACMKLP